MTLLFSFSEAKVGVDISRLKSTKMNEVKPHFASNEN